MAFENSDKKENRSINIELNNSNTAIVKIKNEDGTSSCKKVSLENISKIFSNNITKSTYILPKYCRAFTTYGKTSVYLFIYEPGINEYVTEWNSYIEEKFGEQKDAIISQEEYDFRFKASCPLYSNRLGLRKFIIPYPTLAFIVKVVNNNDYYNLDSAYAYAIKDYNNIDFSKIQAYKWPFTNMYNNGKCCLGGNIHNYKIKNEYFLFNFSSLLLNGIGNKDLTESVLEPDSWESYKNSSSSHFAVPDNGSLGNIWNEFQFLTKLNGLKEFPYEYLKPYGLLEGIFRSI